MMLIRLQRKSARAEIQETCLTDPAHAAVRACAPRGIFCKGFAPWAHDRSIAGAPRGDMKSLDLAEFIRFLWFLYDFGISRGGRAHVARMVFVARDSCPGRMTGVSRVHRAVT